MVARRHEDRVHVDPPRRPVRDERGRDRARRVTRSPTIDLQPAWSPDGRRLAFARTVPGFNTEIYVVGVDGKGLRRLTHNRGQDAEPSWAPNGKRIAWSFGATRVGSTLGHLHDEPGRRGQAVPRRGDRARLVAGRPALRLRPRRRPLDVPGHRSRARAAGDGARRRRAPGVVAGRDADRLPIEPGEPDRPVPAVAHRRRWDEPAAADADARHGLVVLLGPADLARPLAPGGERCRAPSRGRGRRPRCRPSRAVPVPRSVRASDQARVSATVSATGAQCSPARAARSTSASCMPARVASATQSGSSIHSPTPCSSRNASSTQVSSRSPRRAQPRAARPSSRAARARSR